MVAKPQEVIVTYYGYTSYKRGQKEIIEAVLAGRDTVGIMPTGGGKSLCYQVPALILDGYTLVISPLISLMKDQVDELLELGIPATCIHSSLSAAERTQRINATGAGEYCLLYVAPERLRAPSFIQFTQKHPPSQLAIDEAHCISQWGHDFRPSYMEITPFLNGLPQRPTVTAFTATATAQVKKDIIHQLDLQKPKVCCTGFDRPNLYFSVIKGRDRRDFLTEYISQHKNQPGIIYAATRREVDELSAFLRRRGFAAGSYHAGMDGEKRNASQEAFIYDTTPVMVATTAFGMGIDKSNVRYVIHHNYPGDIETYYQQAGRAGRDGEPADCILLYNPSDLFLQRHFIESAEITEKRRRIKYKKLALMRDYGHTSRCLRGYILDYFGEAPENAACGMCSNCDDQRHRKDITVEAQKILSCIVRLHERYGMTMVARVLAGSRSQKVLKQGFDRLSTYGIMKEHTIKDIKSLIKTLIADNYIEMTNGNYPVLKLGKAAKAVLKDEQRVYRQVEETKKREVAYDEDLFENLRKLRLELAHREDVPPYIIFADSTLREMCERRPKTRDSLLKVKGVGEYKLAKYGEDFLNVIKENGN